MKHQYRHANSIRRTFAGEAVALHPYHSPPGLFEATEELVAYLQADKHEMIRIRSWDKFRKLIQQFCAKHPKVIQWNIPKKGKHKCLFVSRYDRPKPEYDFIDLEALARNVYTIIEKDVI